MRLQVGSYVVAVFVGENLEQCCVVGAVNGDPRVCLVDAEDHVIGRVDEPIGRTACHPVRVAWAIPHHPWIINQVLSVVVRKHQVNLRRIPISQPKKRLTKQPAADRAKEQTDKQVNTHDEVGS